MINNLGLGFDPNNPLAGTSLASQWPIYYQSEPESPDQCITVYKTEDQYDGRSMIDGEIYEHKGFMLRIRSTTDAIAGAMAELIRWNFAENLYYAIVTIPGSPAEYTVQAITKKSLISLGKEFPSSERSVYTYNGIAALWRIL